jgi:RNA polymerase sigma-70 factor (ECF subfamily)
MEPRIIDELLIDDCRRGDREAFRLLFEAYKDKVFSIAVYSFRGDEAAAGDVTQQVFLKLMTAIAQFRGDSEFSTWLYRLVVNVCTDEQRRRRRFFPLGDSVAMSRVGDRRPQEKTMLVLSCASQSSSDQRVEAEVSTGDPAQYIEGLSYEEIAAVLDCSMGTVASRLNRGHKALAKRLSHLRGQVVLGE